MSDLSRASFRILDGAYRVHGPGDWAALMKWIREGSVQQTTWVWNSISDTWKLAGEYPELAKLLPSSPSFEGLSGQRFVQPIFAPRRPESERNRWQAGPTSGLAIIAFLSGIAGLWLGPLALLAIGTGHVAEWRFRHTPPVVGGFVLALYGLWLGYLSIGLLLYSLWRGVPLLPA